MADEEFKAGPTGNFPDGKLNPDDAGELGLVVEAIDGNVHINFGLPVTWLAMPPNTAVELAKVLIRQAFDAAGHLKEYDHG